MNGETWAPTGELRHPRLHLILHSRLYWVSVVVIALFGIAGGGFVGVLIGRTGQTAPQATATVTEQATVTVTEPGSIETVVVTIKPEASSSTPTTGSLSASATPSSGGSTWHYLDEGGYGVRIEGYGDDGSGETYSINGITYRHTFTLGGRKVSCGPSCGNYVDPGERLWATWNLDRRCTAFRATLGINANGASSTTYSVYVKADDQIIWATSTPVSFYATQNMAVDLNNALRVEIGAYMDTGERRTESHLVFGDAQFECS